MCQNVSCVNHQRKDADINKYRVYGTGVKNKYHGKRKEGTDTDVIRYYSYRKGKR